MKRVLTIITLISENVHDDFEFEEGGVEAYGEAVAETMADIVDPSQVDEIKVQVAVEDMANE